jgi:GT2 family glycosyltransferase
MVVATLDRPDDLRECLRCLAAQVTTRPVEIIVVDNNPDSGLTAPVVAEFPGVVLVDERRKGLAYARNKGFMTSKAEIVVATDDDVIMPPDWLEKLVAPFTLPEVMIVTGNILPFELETEAQRLFETYGGLGRGFNRRVVDKFWFDQFRAAVPTWTLGATANAAFRASIFSHPQIGLMDEALGPGMPSGVGEDTYLFYKVLKAGYHIVYEPEAWVWHKHRRDLPALRRQIFNYSKGHVAYHLTTLTRDSDWRPLINLAILLPGRHILGALRFLFGKSSYPLSLILYEAAGNLAGPWALWKSRRRVKREGTSRTDPQNR